MIDITFPDGSVRSYEKGITPYQIAEQISPRLAGEVLAASFNGKVIDLELPLNESGELKLHKWEDQEAKSTFWHSSSHLMAEALELLYPGIKFGIGPSIENGFYYDVDLGDRTITDSDLKKIEDKMIELARQKQHFVRKEVSKAEAMDTYTQRKATSTSATSSEVSRTVPSHFTPTAVSPICAADPISGILL